RHTARRRAQSADLRLRQRHRRAHQTAGAARPAGKASGRAASEERRREGVPMSTVSETLDDATSESEVTQRGYDVDRIREDFPGIALQVHGKPRAYLDNAATRQQPRAVIEAVAHCNLRDNDNVHRGVHTLYERATTAFEEARGKVQRFPNA